VEEASLSKLDKKTLERYLELEASARQMENDNVLKTLAAKEEGLKELEQIIKQQQANYDNLALQT
jgi:putative protein kinase ArgK-like GTPase of G3E family